LDDCSPGRLFHESFVALMTLLSSILLPFWARQILTRFPIWDLWPENESQTASVCFIMAFGARALARWWTCGAITLHRGVPISFWPRLLFLAYWTWRDNSIISVFLTK
jgi:hypothetical protein